MPIVIKKKHKKAKAKTKKLRVTIKKAVPIEKPGGVFPFVECKTPNGQPVPYTNSAGFTFHAHWKSFGYTFHCNPDVLTLDNEHLRSLAANLKETRFANIGHVFLQLAGKLVGMSHKGILQWSLAYDDEYTTITLWINVSGHMVALGQFRSEERFIEWREVGGEWQSQEFVPPTKTPKYAPVPDFSQTFGKLPEKKDPISTPDYNKATNTLTPPHGILVEKKGAKKSKIFGFNTTAVIRWMGADAWTTEDAMKALTILGLGHVTDSTVKAQLSDGRTGGSNFGPAAPLSPSQADLLNKLIETPKPKPEIKHGSSGTPIPRPGKGTAPRSAGDRREGKQNPKPKKHREVITIRTRKKKRRG